jgi:diketogulonate reductase-like aldo/keto reductase
MTSRSGLFDFAAVDELKRPAAKYGKSLPQLTLRWTLNNPVVGTALVGFRTPAEIIENLGRRRLGNQQRRYGRDRRHLRPSRRYYIAAGLARRLAHCVTIG